MKLTRLLFSCFLIFHNTCCRRISFVSRHLNIASRSRPSFTLNARVAKKVEEEISEEKDIKNDEMMTLPYNGLIGFEKGALFDKPVEVADPFTNPDSVPIEEGKDADEQAAAILKRLEEKVESLKASGEWEVYVESGKDPLADVPLLKQMAMQLEAAKVFDNFGETLLTYSLVVFVLFVIGGYVFIVNATASAFILWYENTDFDADYFSNLFKFG